MGITLQQIFDKAWDHFIVNNNPPAMEDGICVYLSDTGAKCAVGLSIPDGHPAQHEDIGFANLTIAYPGLFEFPEYCDLNGFQRRLHDSLANEFGKWWVSRESMRQAYISVAGDYGLTVPCE